MKPRTLYQPSHAGDVAQLGERRVRNAEARGSIPLISTNPSIQKTNHCRLVFFCLFPGPETAPDNPAPVVEEGFVCHQR